MERESPQQEEKSSGRTILLHRLYLVGEGIIPRSDFENLSRKDVQTWFEEPDPNKFPPSMEHLKKYLPTE